MTPLALDALAIGDALALAPFVAAASLDAIVTSPPYYGQRDYLPAAHPDKADEIGGEPTEAAYVARLVAVFGALRPALRDDGTLWINLGDRYRPDKQLAGLPWRVAFALQDDGWLLRSDCIWHKPDPMPESVRDRPTRSHEYMFLFAKTKGYLFDAAAVAEPAVNTRKPGRKVTTTEHYSAKNGGNGGLTAVLSRYHDGTAPTTRNRRTVWEFPTVVYPGAHYATYPPDLARVCIRAGSRPGGVVLDPFMGSGTTAEVAITEGRRWIGFDIDADARALVARRLARFPARSLFGQGE